MLPLSKAISAFLETKQDMQKFDVYLSDKDEDIVEIAFASVGLEWRQYVRQDPRFLRPAEPSNLVGNASRAHTLLGWKPEIGFEQLIAEMTRAELTPGGLAA
jgi:GDP-D-mannose dehydratase